MNIRILFFAPAAIIFSGSAHAVCPYDTNCLNNPYGAGFVAKAAHSVDTQDDIKSLKSRVHTLESDLSDAERKAEDAESAAEKAQKKAYEAGQKFDELIEQINRYSHRPIQ